MNADLSVAPEIAQLAEPFGTPARSRAATIANTAGRIAGELSRLAASPQRWWDLVRFDPDGPARIPVPGCDGAWLLILPPGGTAPCDCRYATLLAGEASESPAPPPGPDAPPPGPDAPPPGPDAPPPGPEAPAAPPPTAAAQQPLHPGRVRVRGRRAPHHVRGAGHGYSVSLHFADAPVRSEEKDLFYTERSVAPVPASAIPPQ